MRTSGCRILMKIVRGMLSKMLSRILFWGILLFILAFFLFPLYWLLLTSLKTFRDAFALPPKFFYSDICELHRRIYQQTAAPVYF